MPVEQTQIDANVVPGDVPCDQCSYNLRGLRPEGRCPECGASIQQSLRRRFIASKSAGLIWARSVLAGLTTWLILSPWLLGMVIFMGAKSPGLSPSWVNFPGPKVWGVPFLAQQVAQTGGTLDFVGAAMPLAMVVAIFLLTAPSPGSKRLEPKFSWRVLARWSTALACGGLFGLGVALHPMNSTQLRNFALFALAGVEAPCTLLLYLYLVQLANRLELKEIASLLRVCGWTATACMLFSVAMLAAGTAMRVLAREVIFVVPIWIYGAVTFTAAVVSFACLIRLAMALWPLAVLRSSPEIH